MSPMDPPAVVWRGFLDKVFARQRELFDEIEVGLAGLDSLTAVRNALGALNQRMDSLQNRISEVWEEKMCERFGGPDTTGELMRDQAQIRLDNAWELFKCEAYVRLFEAMWPQIQGLLQGPVACSECGGDMPRQDLKQPETVYCPYCGVVNQLLVDPRVVDYFISAPRAHGMRAALPIRLEADLYEAEQRHAERPQGELQQLERRAALERRYWQAYFEQEARVKGESLDEVSLAAKLEAFRRNVLQPSHAWRRAHAERSSPPVGHG